MYRLIGPLPPRPTRTYRDESEGTLTTVYAPISGLVWVVGGHERTIYIRGRNLVLINLAPVRLYLNGNTERALPS